MKILTCPQYLKWWFSLGRQRKDMNFWFSVSSNLFKPQATWNKKLGCFFFSFFLFFIPFFWPMVCLFDKSACKKLCLPSLTSLLNSESTQRKKEGEIHYSELSHGISVARSWPKAWKTLIFFPTPSYNSHLEMWVVRLQKALGCCRPDGAINFQMWHSSEAHSPEMNPVAQKLILSPKQHIE